MAIDIRNIKADDTTIKHGLILVNIPGTGSQTIEDGVFNTPTIENISGKYQGRWDDPTYYG